MNVIGSYIHEGELFNNNSYLHLPHFSAGVGRTGTFIAIDTMMQRLEEKDYLNIYEFVTYMRTRRTFMVQNQVHKLQTLSVPHSAWIHRLSFATLSY